MMSLASCNKKLKIVISRLECFTTSQFATMSCSCLHESCLAKSPITLGLELSEGKTIGYKFPEHRFLHKIACQSFFLSSVLPFSQISPRVGFWGEDKIGVPREEVLRAEWKTNKFNHHVASRPESNPGHIGDWGVFSPDKKIRDCT